MGRKRERVERGLNIFSEASEKAAIRERINLKSVPGPIMRSHLTTILEK